MNLEPDAQGIRPENLRRQQVQEKALVDRGEFDGTGDFGSYYAFRTGVNRDCIRAHAVSDEAWAADYARGARHFLQRQGAWRDGGDVLDVGCGPGIITNALRTSLAARRTCGIDISEDGTRYGREHYPACEYYCTSAEEMTGLEGARFDLVHAREVYPVTRTDSLEYQAAFLGALARCLKPGGVVLLQMMRERRGLGNTYAKIGGLLYPHGLGPVECHLMAPRRLVREIGATAYRPIVYGPTNLVMRLLFPRKAGFFYLTRKAV